MKKIVLLILVALGLASTIFTSCSKSEKVDMGDLKNMSDSVSYIIGHSMGVDMKTQNVEVNPEILMKAFALAYGGDTSSHFNPQQMQEIMMKYQQSLQAKQLEDAKSKSKPNREKGEKFLSENKTKGGVKSLPSGLQYIVEKEGKGDSPKSEDRVRVHYVLKSIDGKIIESTIERGDPVILSMKGVVPGMAEALSIMKPGGNYKIWIPADLAYGDADMGEIPPGSTLCFEMQLVEVVKG